MNKGNTLQNKIPIVEYEIINTSSGPIPISVSSPQYSENDLISPGLTAPITGTPPGDNNPVSEFGYLYALIASGLESSHVNISNPTNGQGLIYNSSTGKWENAAISGGVGGPFLPLVGGEIVGTPGNLIVTAPAGDTGAILSATVNGSNRLVVSADSAHQLQMRDTSGTGPTAELQIIHRLTSGSPGTGFGSSLSFWGENSANAAVLYGTLRTEVSDTTAAAVDSDLVFQTSQNSTPREVLRIRGQDGYAAFRDGLEVPTIHVGDDVSAVLGTINVSRTPAASPTQETYLRVLAVDDTGLSGGRADVNFNLSANHQLLAGSYGTLPLMQVVGGTFSAPSASTISIAATLFINSAPIAGSNMTLTETYSLYCNGTIRIDKGAMANVFFLNRDDTPASGSITGRIPVNFGGVQRYIPVYS
jgi:hypothetical protein